MFQAKTKACGRIKNKTKKQSRGQKGQAHILEMQEYLKRKAAVALVYCVRVMSQR